MPNEPIDPNLPCNEPARQARSWVECPTGSGKAARRVKPCTTIDDPIYTTETLEGTVVGLSNMFALASTSGFLDGENYDEIVYGKNENDLRILTYINEGISQFQVTFKLLGVHQFIINKRPAQFPLLQENGDFLLQENGDVILIEGLVP